MGDPGQAVERLKALRKTGFRPVDKAAITPAPGLPC